MREIEVKARIKSVGVVIEKLEQVGVHVSEPVRQHDEVFGLPGVAGDSANSEPWLRIRTETKNSDTTILFTLKKSVTNQLDSIEHETVVSDADELRQIILHSGFEPYSEVTKTRRKANVGDIELCVDVVERLGDFVEAEKLTDEDADYSSVVQELWRVLENFGASRHDEVADGYDTMMENLKKTP